MKKICFITTIPSTVESFILRTAEYIHENTDWDISIICSGDEDFEKKLPEYIRFFPVKMERGISLSGVFAMLRMLKIFRKEKFDLIQYSTPNASLYASLAGKLAGVPVRLYCQWGMVFVGFEGLKRKVFRAEEKLVCSLSAKIEPDSKSNLEFAVSEGLYPREKGKVIFNGSACGVDLSKFDITKKDDYRAEVRKERNIPDDAFVFGFVGRITRDKGINELLRAYFELRENNENTYLMLVGRPEADETVSAELRSRAESDEKVIFTGYTDVVERYLSAMDCYLLPSYREGFGMGVIEAEAMGVPVIVTDIPGPTDAMRDGETGTVVPKKDVAALKSAMEKIMSSPEDAGKYGAAGVKLVRECFEQRDLFGHILEDRRELLKE